MPPMTYNWTPAHYLKHITDNHLDEWWAAWCNPNSIDGIRLAAYTPIYSDERVEWYTRKCKRKGCDGYLSVPPDEQARRVITKLVCNGTINGSACGNYEHRIFRWVSSWDKTKLTFQTPETVRKYALDGRTFYSTLMIFSKDVLPGTMDYVHESTYRAYSLGIDIDIERKSNVGTICDLENREALDACRDICHEWLDTVCPGSYCEHTSGNGTQIMVHHSLCTKSIYEAYKRFNAQVRALNEEATKRGIKRAKIDPINMNNRVFKMPGTIHQYYDLVAIPLEFDCKLTRMYADDFKLKNFTIDRFLDADGKLKWYNRKNTNESTSLYKYLFDDSNFKEANFSGLNARRYEINNTLNESPPPRVTAPEGGKIKWIRYDYPTGGDILYRINDAKQLEVLTFGVSREERNIIIKQLRIKLKLR